jgi:general secretion pathway protein K
MLKSLKIIREKQGIALLITLSVTAILVAAALEYNRRARFAVVSTASMRDRLTLAQMAAGGVHAAMALLVKDKSESNVDSLQENWANPEKIEEIIQEIPFEDGKLTVVITDELGRIQINALVDFPDSRQFKQSQVMLWDRLLRHMGNEEEMKDDSDPVAIINSIKDWLDSGDDEATSGLSGAESSYYEDLLPPYASRNNPIPDVNELLLIKGITPGLFYGSEEKAGIAKYLTVHGMTAGEGTTFTWPGRINLNTADLPVLVALLPSESGDLAQLLYDYRQEMAAENDLHDFSNPQWYKNVPAFSDVSIDPDLITTASDIFRIESIAELNSTKSTVTAVIQRVQNDGSGNWTCKILSWQTE